MERGPPTIADRAITARIGSTLAGRRTKAGPQWTHITDLDWEVLPTEAALSTDHGVVFRQTAAPVSLLRFVLSQKQQALNHADLSRWLGKLAIPHPKQLRQEQLSGQC
jgi:hypothetical protein